MNKETLINMTDEIYTRYMVQTYPSQFQNISRPMTETCMCWGFEIGPGWRPILDSLCAKLVEIEKIGGPTVIFDQIKEKFGSACFYNSVILANTGMKDETVKLWGEICDDLVSYHEQECDRIDDVTGEWCNPLDKIIISGWYYGCTAKGYLSHLQRKFKEDIANGVLAEEADKYFTSGKERLMMGKKRTGTQITEKDLI